MDEEMKILSTEEQVVKQLVKSLPRNSTECNYAFYSSLLDGIITDPAMMTVPLDDKLIHRGYGVYETITVRSSFVYNLEKKIQALYKYADTLKLRPPFDIQYTEAVVLALVNASKKCDCQITLWMSPGPGDFSLYLDPKRKATLYGLCHKEIDTLPGGPEIETKKEGHYAPIKTTNYVLSCINSTRVKSKGGYLGILVDENDYILEATMANVGLILQSGELLIPPFDRTLAGTTALRLLEYANEVLIPKKILTGICRDNIKLADAKEKSKEVMLLGGNLCVPILKWDDHVISKKPGAITVLIQKFFQEIDCKMQEESLSTLRSKQSFREVKEMKAV